MSVHMTAAAEAESGKPMARHGPESSAGVRSLVVTIGPSLLLNWIFTISTVLTLRGLQRRRKGHLPRLLRLIALVGALAPWLYLLVVRRWVLHWGATEGEANEDLPGDEIVPKPVWQSTRAIDIAAPVHAVWPWLAQMGQNRGGLYSYDWLENVAGLDFHNADHIVPEWQEVKVGDLVRFAPDQNTLVVAQVEPDQCLVWRLLTPGTGEPGDLSSGSIAVDATWAFVLRGVDAEHTRLIQRFRFGARPRLLGLLYPPLMEIPHFVMERGMLQGIRERAERADPRENQPDMSQGAQIDEVETRAPEIRRLGYAARTTYRKPSRLRRLVNGIVAWLAGMGLTPADTVRLEVAGRRTGMTRAFAVTLAISGGERYLVSLAGESDWVRNLRAAGGKAVLRHGRRAEVSTKELPVSERAAVLAAYLSKRALSKSAAAAARDYFGLHAHPSSEALANIAEHYPVFKVIGTK